MDLDPTIWAAIISGGSGLGAAGVPYYLERRKRKSLERGATGGVSIFDQLVEKYGFKVRQQIHRVKIQDESGRVTIRREYHDLEVVVDGFRVRTLSHMHEGTDSSYTPATVEVLQDGNVQIVSRDRSGMRGGGVVELELKPDGLQRGRRLSYAVTYSAEGCLFSKRENIEAKYADDLFKLEYYAGMAQFPVGELLVDVEFPDGRPCSCNPVVFLPRSEVSLERFSEHVESGFSATASGARLVVKQPLIEFGYAICWTGR